MNDHLPSSKLGSLKQGCHASLVFRDREEQMAMSIPFILIGLHRNEQCLYLADPLTIECVKEHLKNAGVEVQKEIQKGALTLTSARDHLNKGLFDPEKMIGFLDEAVNSSLRSGYAGFRATGDVIWELGTDLDLKKLFRYEAMLDAYFENKKIVGLCQYSMKVMPPRFIRHSLYTHPVVVHDKKICSNTFYNPNHIFQELSSEESEYRTVSSMCGQLVAAANPKE